MKNSYVNGFNSTLVRLKGGDSVAMNGKEVSFQFHIGSIKSGGADSSSVATIVFQFHIGSIKSTNDDKRNLNQVTRFNSTLVRLKDDRSYALQE